MKTEITMTPELYNLLTADICDDEFTADELLEMIKNARESIAWLILSANKTWKWECKQWKNRDLNKSMQCLSRTTKNCTTHCLNSLINADLTKSVFTFWKICAKKDSSCLIYETVLKMLNNSASSNWINNETEF